MYVFVCVTHTHCVLTSEAIIEVWCCVGGVGALCVFLSKCDCLFLYVHLFLVVFVCQTRVFVKFELI